MQAGRSCWPTSRRQVMPLFQQKTAQLVGLQSKGTTAAGARARAQGRSAALTPRPSAPLRTAAGRARRTGAPAAAGGGAPPAGSTAACLPLRQHDGGYWWGRGHKGRTAARTARNSERATGGLRWPSCWQAPERGRSSAGPCTPRCESRNSWAGDQGTSLPLSC